jgi:hypothetical protein
MPYVTTVCRTCDALTREHEHGAEDEYCEAPDGLERIELYVEREVDERVARAIALTGVDIERVLREVSRDFAGAHVNAGTVVGAIRRRVREEAGLDALKDPR